MNDLDMMKLTDKETGKEFTLQPGQPDTWPGDVAFRDQIHFRFPQMTEPVFILHLMEWRDVTGRAETRNALKPGAVDWYRLLWVEVPLYQRFCVQFADLGSQGPIFRVEEKRLRFVPEHTEEMVLFGILQKVRVGAHWEEEKK